MNGAVTYDSIEKSMKYQVKMMRCCGLVRDDGCPSYQWLVSGLGLLATVQIAYSVSLSIGKLEPLVVLIYHLILFGAPSLLVLIPITYGARSMHLILTGSYTSYDYKNDFMNLVQNKIINDGKIKSRQVYFKRVCLLLLFAKMPTFILAFKGKRPIQLCDLWYPEFINRDILAVNICTYAYEQFMAFMTALIIYSVLMAFLVAYSQLTTELELLRVGVEELDQRARAISREYSVSLEDGYRQALRMVVQHHQNILSYYNGASTIVMLFLNTSYIVGSSLLILTGVTLTSGSLSPRFILLSVSQLVFIYSVSWCAEEIGTKAERVSEAVYGVNWMILPKDCRSTLRIFLLVSQRPLTFTLFYGTTVNSHGFMELIKASYSYFNLMLATMNDAPNT